MARECVICGKKRIMVGKWVKLRGKYNPTGKRKKYPNLQFVRIPSDVKRDAFKRFAGKRVLSCVKCIRTLKKTK